MCGRYTLGTGEEALIEAFDVSSLTFDFVPRYNIAPGQQAPVVAEDRHGRRIGLLTWGLVPSWVDSPKSGLINARSESVASKPSFREAFQRRRCLVPADGFYEWKRTAAGKVPYWFHPPDGDMLSFAGIWESWSRPGADPRFTFAILTTEANEDIATVHDRMPVVVEAPDRASWLSRTAHESNLLSLLRPAPAGTFAGHTVSTRVNRVSEDDAELSSPSPPVPSPNPASSGSSHSS